MDFNEKLLTVKEVLELTSVSRHTLYRDAKSGIIEQINFGKSVRFREADVMRYAEDKKCSNKVKYYANKKKEGN